MLQEDDATTTATFSLPTASKAPDTTNGLSYVMTNNMHNFIPSLNYNIDETVEFYQSN